MRYAQLVMGPAGSGKSTYCTALAAHAQVRQKKRQKTNKNKTKKGSGKSAYCTALAAHAQVRYLLWCMLFITSKLLEDVISAPAAAP